MRTLKFIVNRQIIEPDNDCDFSNIVPGTEGYLVAEFAFSSDWNGCAKVAEFTSIMGKEYPPQILKDGKSCIIPAEALAKTKFNIRIIGKREGFKITTNKVTVRQNGGN